MAVDFMQICYVTNDFDRAVERMRRIHDMGPFKEIRDHVVPTGPDRAAIGHFGLAFKGELQIELIEPLDGDVDFYRDFLAGDGFLMCFHHVGRHIASADRYREALEEAKRQWPVPIEMSGFGGYYAYADARAELGHYLELLCFPDAGDGAHPTDAPRY